MLLLGLCFWLLFPLSQGEHKIQRGYLPTMTHSAHYVKDPRFRTILKDFLRQEQQQIDYTLEVLNQELSPYKESQ